MRVPIHNIAKIKMAAPIVHTMRQALVLCGVDDVTLFEQETQASESRMK